MSNEQGGLKQPFLGIMGFYCCAFYYLWHGYMVWARVVDCVGRRIVYVLHSVHDRRGMVWGGNYPAPAASLAQPLKGMYLLFLSMVVGALVAGWSIRTVGGFATPPTPPLIFFTS